MVHTMQKSRNITGQNRSPISWYAHAQKIQNGRLKKKLSFSTLSKVEQFPPKFHGLGLGLV